MTIQTKLTWILTISVITFLLSMTVDEYNSLHWGIRLITVISRLSCVISMSTISMSLCIILILLNHKNDDNKPNAA